MGKPYVMRQADLADLETVMAMVGERAAWLRDRGSDQWNQEGKDYSETMIKRIERGHTWLLEDDGQPIGTASIRRKGKAAFWTPEELAEPAFYGWKMASVVERNGQGLGKLMLQWMQDRAAELDLKYMRWTSWQTNEQLMEYWKKLGAEFVRIVDVEGKVDGALFQLPAKRIDGLAAQVRTVLDESREAAGEQSPKAP